MCLDSLFKLKAHYRKFKATLFVIPMLTSPGLFDELALISWLELAMHGFEHEPNKEMEKFHSMEKIEKEMWKALERYQFWGFKAPGWYITKEAIEACNDLGLWVALHPLDYDKRKFCNHGYYICNSKYPYWHGHTHDVCDNWIDKKVDALLSLWPKDQEFIFVSGALEMKK